MRLWVCLVFFVLCQMVQAYHHHHRFGRSAGSPNRGDKPPIPTTCDPDARYSHMRGTCNNLKHPGWGAALEPFKRFVYKAAQSEARTLSKNGSPLPSARTVSTTYHPPSNATSDVTLMLMQFGQFLDHDIALTHHDDMSCCPVSSSSDPKCFPILMESDEYFDSTCMNFVRSDRSLDSEEQSMENINSITSYIDGSNIYGSSDEELDTIKGLDGQLRYESENVLPTGDQSSCFPKFEEYCFLAGDGRVNEQPGLAAMHTVWMREHNRVAKKMKMINNKWTSDQVFQETRKIIGAVLQKITYSEWLPLVLGKEYDLNSKYSYSDNTGANIFNSFATAAFRFGHTLIPEQLTINGEAIAFKTLFHSPSLVFNSLNGLADTLAEDKAPAADRHFSHSITRHLFERSGPRSGMDLVARNIQRGRDHHILTYNEARDLKVCKLKKVKKLDDLYKDVPNNVYSDIDDVDLFSGGMTEKLVKDGLVGETFACILNEQFRRLREGDRFFYQHRGQKTSFTDAQIREIEKMSLAKVICENTENKNIQPEIFLPAASKGKNRKVSCDDIPDLDIDYWRELIVSDVPNDEGPKDKSDEQEKAKSNDKE